MIAALAVILCFRSAPAEAGTALMTLLLNNIGPDRSGTPR